MATYSKSRGSEKKKTAFEPYLGRATFPFSDLLPYEDRPILICGIQPFVSVIAGVEM